MARIGRPPKTKWAVCSVPNCDRSVEGGARGFCSSHYQQMRKGLIDKDGLETGRRTRLHRKGAPCLAEGCEDPAVGKGLCSRHYQQERTVESNRSARRRDSRCFLCNSEHWARGFCQAHYAQFRRGIIDENGNSLRPLKRVRKVKAGAVCRQPGCGSPVRSKGWCNKHYIQYRDGILDEEGNQLRELKSSGRSGQGYAYTSQGYKKLMRKDHPRADRYGYVLEHRLLMEEHLDRYLEPGEVVHHVNGIRDDNRIENLQLRRSRKDHGHGHERLDTVEAALDTLERLANKGMSNSREYKKRLQRVARRL